MSTSAATAVPAIASTTAVASASAAAAGLISPKHLRNQLIAKGNPASLSLRSEVVDATALAQRSSNLIELPLIEQAVHLFKVLTLGVVPKSKHRFWLIQISRRGIHQQVANYLFGRLKIQADADFFKCLSANPRHQGALTLLNVAELRQGLVSITIDGPDVVERWVRSLAIKNQDQWLYPVVNVYDPKELLRRGLVPVLEGLTHRALSDYLDGLSRANLVYWHGPLVALRLKSLKDRMYAWEYHTMTSHRSDAINSDWPLACRYLQSESFYHSGRFKHTMDNYRSAYSTVVPHGALTTLDRAFPYLYSWSDQYLLPVIAYGDPTEPMRYHYEPQSSVYLRFTTAIQSFNHLTAKSAATGARSLVTSQQLEGELPDDLILDPWTVNRLLGSEDSPLPPGPVSRYAGHRLGMVEVSDEQWQALVTTTRIGGYDLLILTSQAGEHGVGVMCLDARPVVESLDALVWT
jgi:hypothetical protein